MLSEEAVRVEKLSCALHLLIAMRGVLLFFSSLAYVFFLAAALKAPFSNEVK